MVELTQGKEEIMDTRLVSDIEVSSNNGVLAIEPVPEGRLRSLVSITKAGMKRIWLFKGIAPYRDSDGDTRIDHLARGVMTRSFSDGQDFLTMREGIGLKS